MAQRVVYIERSERGSRLTGARLVSSRTDERWEAPPEAGQDGEQTVERAAEWIVSRSGNSRRLAMLVLDAEGSVCFWTTVPAADPAMVEAIVRQQADGMDDRPADTADGAGSSGRASVFGFYAPGASDSTIQPLASSRVDGGQESDGRRRTAVMAITDGIARVLVDAIDRMGVQCEGSSSIWHALALAWDPPAAGRPSPPSEHVVADSPAAPIAIVVVEPRGRLLWAWSQSGRLLVGGGARLATRRNSSPDQPEVEVPLLTRDLAARLTADWLAWAAQVAIAPDRIVAIIPTSAQEAQDDSLGAGGFGRALAQAWGQAPVDVAVHEDPIGATLHRIADQLEDRDEAATPARTPEPGSMLVSLSSRPGGAHRRMYLWTSLAVTAGAVCIGALAWGLRVQASRVNALSRQVEDSWKDSFKEVKLARPPMPGLEMMELKSEVERVRHETLPISGVEPARPIVREFETLSQVLALPDFDLTSIALDSQSGRVTIQVNAPDLSSAEALSDALGRIADSAVASWTFVPGTRIPGSDKVPCTYTGAFQAPSAAKPAGGSS